MHELKNVIGIEVMRDFVVRLPFSDGIVREIDLEALLHGPIFEPIKANMDFFRSVYVDDEAGTIAWPNEADMDPNVLYYDHLIPAWMEELETINANWPMEIDFDPQTDASYIRFREGEIDDTVCRFSWKSTGREIAVTASGSLREGGRFPLIKTFTRLYFATPQ